jgi:ATP-dependent RNA helicase SUPV3L1/SUV3
MLERLADMLRNQDTRGGFEATPDMLSITGLTLEQFADLMTGLGYRAERGERPKVKASPAPGAEEPASASGAPETIDESLAGELPQTAPTGLEGADTPDPSPQEVPVGPPPEAPPEPPSETPADQPDETPSETPTEVPGETPGEVPPDNPGDPGEDSAAAEAEVFYTFTWAPKRRGADRPQRKADAGAGKPRGKKPRSGKPKGKGGKPQGDKPKTYSSRPERGGKKVDPDSPFAVLAALKDQS